MAIIYDMMTGKVISEEAVVTGNRKPSLPRKEAVPSLHLQTVTNPQTQEACSAYMVLLQRLLKDL